MIKHLTDITDFTVEELDALMDHASEIMRDPGKYSNCCKGKKLASLFFEPSTRTRLSFESAMIELGGDVLGFESGANSSAAKGESIRDTVKVVSCYADIIAMRHPEEGAGIVGAKESHVPVINAGDGGHHHPTQTLADLFTIKSELGTLDNITVGFCGDLKYGRTVHSLVSALERHKNVKMVFISPSELKMPTNIKSEITASGIDFSETRNLEKALPTLDVLYMTRIQKERFDDIEQYQQVEGSYILTTTLMKLAKEKMCVLHPLPRVNEVSAHVDSDPRSSYFRQAFYGKIMRKALIIKLLSETPAYCGFMPEASNGNAVFNGRKMVESKYSCDNEKCVTKFEQEIEEKFHADENGKIYCAYCDKEITGEILEYEKFIISDK